MKSDNEKVLIVGPSWVGDMVMSQALYTYLKESRPDVSIDVLAPAWSEPLLQRMPEVNAALTKPIGHGELALGRRRRLGRELRSTAYDQAIILPNSIKAALVPFLARIPRRTGWRGELRYGLLNDLRRLDTKALPLMVQRFVALGQEAGASLPTNLPTPSLTVRPEAARACSEHFGLATDQPLLALCPGAEFGAAKRWPADYFATLAADYLQQGWQLALFGSERDAGVTAAIAAAFEGHASCHDLAGRTTLSQAIDLLSLADAVVSNDSGLMHIAAALQRPTMVIYGPTSPDFTPPLSARAAMQVSELECAPCFQRECPLQHHRCMREALPEQVADKLSGLIAMEESQGVTR
jgi:heptosyltransferase-2